jgi:hypothetical protein
MMRYMVFDVESVGLHGEGFAVGWVVINPAGIELSSGCIACLPSCAFGYEEGLNWVEANVSIPDDAVRVINSRAVRDAFWKVWMHEKLQGAVLVAECAWPVEARFLIACVEDDLENRTWDGPYPLHDVATHLMARGLDPMAPYPRLENELPAHNPLADARQSARLFLT